MSAIRKIFPGTRVGGHEESIVDCAFDTGKRHLATVSSQGTVSLFKRPERQEEWAEECKWEVDGRPSLCKVCWSSPVYGSLLAIGSNDGRVTLWAQEPLLRSESSSRVAEIPIVTYQKKGTVSVLGPPVTIEFAPRDKGLTIAVASAKQVRVFKPSPRGDYSWQLESEVDSSRLAFFTSLAWQPSGQNMPPMLLIGSHKHAKLWMYHQTVMEWQSVYMLHQADISAVAWASSANRPKEMVAVASKAEVQILGLTAHVDKPQVEQVAVLKQPAAVRRLSWHPLGSWLAVSLVTSEVHLWRPNLAGEWKLIQQLVGSSEEQMDQ